MPIGLFQKVGRLEKPPTLWREFGHLLPQYGVLGVEAHQRTGRLGMSVRPEVFAAALAVDEHLVVRTEDTDKLALVVGDRLEEPLMRPVV